MDFQLEPEYIRMRTAVREFVNAEIAPGAAARDETETFDRDIFEKLRKMGLSGIPWPEEYGGAGMDFLAYALVVEELSRACASTAAVLCAHTSLASWPIYRFGNDIQKRKYLTALSQGEYLGAFALTEPGAGSDAANMTTTARRTDGGYVLNGSKIFITNGGVADLYVIFAVTGAGPVKKEISAFIMEKDVVGFAVGRQEKKMGIRGTTTAELIFSDCFIPEENRLGEEGAGFKIAMATLDGGRNGIAAQALGIAQGAFERALSYAQERQQFGRPISDNQGIQFKLADMAIKIEAARLLTYQAAWRESAGFPYSIQSSISKVFASDAAMQASTEAVQILGGYGFIRDYTVERLMRDAKITQIYEGTNEIQRLVIFRHLSKNGTVN